MTRRPLRRLLLRVGAFPALVAIVLLVKVVTMMSNDQDGRDDFTVGDFGAAVDHFAANQTWNWFEPWIAPFDEGTAQHAQGGYDEAIARYDTALETVPDVEECTVRINQALAHEALGDAAQGGTPPNRDEAVQHWQAGIDTLAAGNCPTDSGRGEEQTEEAATVDERLRSKLEEPEQQELPQQPDQQSQQEQELEERNQRGQEERQDQREGGSQGQEQEGTDEPDDSGGSGSGPGGSGGTPPPAW